MREPVTLHVLSFIQGHHTNHSTEFILTSEGGDPERSEDVISRITYPVSGVLQAFIEGVAADMDTVLTGKVTIHEPHGWIDHISYNGYREVSDSDE